MPDHSGNMVPPGSLSSIHRLYFCLEAWIFPGVDFGCLFSQPFYNEIAPLDVYYCSFQKWEETKPMNLNHVIICSLLTIAVHEFGHYLIARKEGIYKGWGIFPNPHIKITQPYGSRWSYLSGLVASLFLFPLWLWIFGAKWIWLFFLFCLLLSGFDLIVVIFYGRLLKRRRKKKT